MSHTILNQDIENKLKEIIKNQFGTLSDLPRDLSNTILNIYYRSIVRMKESENKKGAWIPSDIINSKDFFEGYKKYVEHQSNDISYMEILPKIISDIRGVRTDSNQEKAIYDYMVELTLDIFKYNIKNANKKTPLRRRIERKFVKVDEIPNLVDLINT